ncbi:MAG: ZIP family metal transporter [Nanoarchaeota archaeon]
MNIWFYTLVSVIVVSLISLIGIITLPFKNGKVRKILIYFVSFSAGGLLGDVFIHLLPESTAKLGFGINISLYVLIGIVTYFIVEKIIRWQHCHTRNHTHPFSFMIIYGDAVHNFIDGLIIGASYLVNLETGVATTLAVLFHEIPQEIGDFGTLLHGGLTKSRALLFNFLSAITSILGAIVVLSLKSYADNLISFLIPFAAGGFIYIAGADLIPELHKEVKISKSILQLFSFIIGVLVMLSLVYF